MNQIENISAGYSKVIKLFFSKGINVIESIPLNQGRYYIIKTTEGNCLVCFKRDFFYSFGTIFKDENESGLGETINLDDLKLAISRKNINQIMFVYPSGAIYSITLQDFLVNSHKRVNDFEGKETRSISIKHLKREE